MGLTKWEYLSGALAGSSILVCGFSLAMVRESGARINSSWIEDERQSRQLGSRVEFLLTELKRVEGRLDEEANLVSPVANLDSGMLDRLAQLEVRVKELDAQVLAFSNGAEALEPEEEVRLTERAIESSRRRFNAILFDENQPTQLRISALRALLRKPLYEGLGFEEVSLANSFISEGALEGKNLEGLIRGMSDTGMPEFIPGYIAALRDQNDLDVLHKIVRALGPHVEDTRAYTALQEIWSGDYPESVRKEAGIYVTR